MFGYSYSNNVNNYAVSLDSNSSNKLSNELKIGQVGTKVNVFTHLNASGFNLELRSNDSTNLIISGLNITPKATGEYYLYVVDKINDCVFDTNTNSFVFKEVEQKVCISTIIVGDGPSRDVSLVGTDQNGDQLTNYSNNYVSIGNEQFIRMQVGETSADTPSVLNIRIDNYIGKVEFNSIENVTVNETLTEVSETEPNINNIAEKNKTARNLSYFNGKAIISINEVDNGTTIRIEPSITLKSEALGIAIVVEDETFFINILANRVTGFEAIPSEDTLPTAGSGTETDPYIYSIGDTIRFETNMVYENPNLAYMVEVKYENGDDTQDKTKIDVKTNGTVKIKNTAQENDIFVIMVSLLDGTPTTLESEERRIHVYIKVGSSVDITYDLSGCIVNKEKTDRVAVKNSQYKFAVSSTAGHGLDPTLTISNDAGFSWSGKVSRSGNTINANGVIINYEVTNTGEFIFTLPSDIVKNETLNISLSFPLVYTILFTNERGTTFNTKYYIITVEAGKTLSDLYSAGYFDGLIDWKEQLLLDMEPRGFVYGGLYMTQNANSMSDYGESFDSMVNQSGTTINGTMAFYIRWQFSLTTKVPDNVEIKSTMNPAILEENSLLPINDKKGFAFEIGVQNDWLGTPRFDFYIGDTSITDLFVKESIQNRYHIEAEVLYNKIQDLNNANLILVTYADSLYVYQGDANKKTSENKVYEDGIFTVEYKLNYGRNDTIDLSKDIIFNFTNDLPIGTNISLYYSKDGIASWAGNQTIGTDSNTDTKNNEIYLSKFKAMYGMPNSIDRSNVKKSEEFNLVVTLPNNKNNFIITGKNLSVEISTDAYHFVPNVKEYKGKDTLNGTDTTIQYNDNETSVIFYNTIVRSIKEGTVADTLKYYVEDDNYMDEVIDLRHTNLYYFIEITKMIIVL